MFEDKNLKQLKVRIEQLEDRIRELENATERRMSNLEWSNNIFVEIEGALYPSPSPYSGGSYISTKDVVEKLIEHLGLKILFKAPVTRAGEIVIQPLGQDVLIDPHLKSPGYG